MAPMTTYPGRPDSICVASAVSPPPASTHNSAHKPSAFQPRSLRQGELILEQDQRIAGMYAIHLVGCIWQRGLRMFEALSLGLLPAVEKWSRCVCCCTLRRQNSGMYRASHQIRCSMYHTSCTPKRLAPISTTPSIRSYFVKCDGGYEG